MQLQEKKQTGGLYSKALKWQICSTQHSKIEVVRCKASQLE